MYKNVTKLSIVCILFTMTSLGCVSGQSIFKRRPEITKAEFSPKYICTNEPKVTFTWAGNNFDRLEILKATGEPLLILRSDQGSMTTPPITSEMLPLQAKAYMWKESISFPVELANIDKPTWSIPYPSASENGRELQAEFTRVEQEVDQEGT